MGELIFGPLRGPEKLIPRLIWYFERLLFDPFFAGIKEVF